MPVWLIPALTAILPHVGTIVSAASPVFTKKPADAANQAMLLQQQITELQIAAAANDAHIKELAVQIQQAVTALEQAALIAERRHRQIVIIGIAVVTSAALSMCIALWVLLTR